MNTISNEMFMDIFIPILIYSIIGALFFAASMQNIINNFVYTGIAGYLIGTGIMYIGLMEMEMTMIDMGIVEVRVHITEILMGFYLVSLLYILFKTKRGKYNDIG